ncbi:MAG: hypothetical protein AAFW70_04395 [Cyanobacteria bacterium J06635_10]
MKLNWQLLAKQCAIFVICLLCLLGTGKSAFASTFWDLNQLDPYLRYDIAHNPSLKEDILKSKPPTGLYSDGKVYDLNQIDPYLRFAIMDYPRVKEDILKSEPPTALYGDGVVYDLNQLDPYFRDAIAHDPRVKEEIIKYEPPTGLYSDNDDEGVAAALFSLKK